MTAALALCTNDKNDTIVVLDYWQPAGETWPVDVNKSKVRIIGSPSGSARAWVCMNPPGDTASLDISASDVHIRDIYFDAGVSHGGIEFSDGVCRVGIHRCWFGTGAYGVYDNTGGVAFSLEIADCYFCQALTSHGIYVNDDPAFLYIHDNMFDACQGDAINIVQGGGDRVINNIIACSSDLQGTGITLGASVYRCLCAWNVANFGDADMAANPFEDGAAGDTNHWMANYKGITIIHPA